MKRYVYPKFDGLDLILFRIGGSGLGNLFYVFFQALVFAKQNNLRVISPTFYSFKYKLLFKKQNRSYRYHYPNSVNGLLRFWLLTRNYTGKKNKIQTFEGFGNHFESLYGYEDYLKNEIKSLIKLDKPNFYLKYNNHICCHIRLGDFSSYNKNNFNYNMRLPLKWYIAVINYLRKDYENLNVYIFSDGNKSELKDLLNLKNVYLETSSEPVLDMLKLGSGKYLICSNSSFSCWGSFFSNGDVIWHPNIYKFNNNLPPINSNNFIFKKELIKI